MDIFLVINILAGIAIIFGIGIFFAPGANNLAAGLVAIGAGVWAFQQSTFAPLVIGFIILWILRLAGTENKVVRFDAPPSKRPTTSGLSLSSNAVVNHTTVKQEIKPEVKATDSASVNSDFVEMLSQKDVATFSHAIRIAIAHLENADFLLETHIGNSREKEILVRGTKRKLNSLIRRKKISLRLPADLSEFMWDQLAGLNSKTDFDVWACFYDAYETIENWQEPSSQTPEEIISLERQFLEDQKRGKAECTDANNIALPFCRLPSPAETEVFKVSLSNASPLVKEALKLAKKTNRTTQFIAKIEALQRKMAGARRRKLIDFALMVELEQAARDISTDLDPVEDFDLWHNFYEVAEELDVA
tara:strand:+ start:28525 stop:29607 length:1083 start_codon:yes stop_codon:yes gene_type:complete